MGNIVQTSFRWFLIVALVVFWVGVFTAFMSYFGGMHDIASGQIPTTSGQQVERDPFRGIRAMPRIITGLATIVGSGNTVDVTIPTAAFPDTSDWVPMITSRKVQGSGVFFCSAYTSRLTKNSFRITKTTTTTAPDTVGWDWVVIER